MYSESAPNTDLSYESIQSGKAESFDGGVEFYTIQGFSLSSKPSPWIMFGHNLRGASSIRGGWKAHIGFDDSDLANVVLAWDTLLPILRAHEIGYGKIVRKGVSLANTNPEQCGKQMTIYCFKQMGHDVNWIEFFTDVTRELRAAGVRPSPISGSDTKLRGSEYVSYRFDSARDTRQAPPPGDDPMRNHGSDPFRGAEIDISELPEAARPGFEMQTESGAGSSGPAGQATYSRRPARG